MIGLSEEKGTSSCWTDAHLAAILRQYGVRRLYTSDVDYRRFDFLEIRDPLA